VVDSPAKCSAPKVAKASIFESPAYWAVVGAVALGGVLVYSASKKKKTLTPNRRRR
jgi:hypothetical protein